MKLNKGDYVVATKYQDGDPRDEFAIGFFSEELDYSPCENRYQVVDENGNNYRGNGFRKIRKISAELGNYLVSNLEQISNSKQSVWIWIRNWNREKRLNNLKHIVEDEKK